MNKLLNSVLAGTVLVCVAMGAAQAQNLAVVNGKPIPQSRVDALVQQVSRSGRQVTPDMMEEIKKAVIDREVLVQEAQKEGLDSSADFKSQMELMHDNLLIRELVTNYQKNNPVSDAEIQAEYDKFKAANSGKEYHARHILVATEAEAKDVIAQLKKGAKFEALAKKRSKDTGSGARGGDLDWAAPGNFVKEFSDAMVALPKGKYTETPVKTQFGWHVIRLDDIRDAQLPKLEDIKPQIAQQLGQQKLQKFQEDLRAKAKIE